MSRNRFEDAASMWPAAALAGGGGLMAVMASMMDGMKAPDPEKMAQLHQVYVDAVTLWMERERRHFDMFLYRVERLHEGHVPSFGEAMEDMEETRLLEEANREMNRAYKALADAQERFRKGPVDRWRSRLAEHRAVRVMELLLGRMGVVLEALDQEHNDDLGPKKTRIRTALSKMWIGSDQERRADRCMDAIFSASHLLLLNGFLGWSAVAEHDLTTLTGPELQEKYGKFPAMLQLDEHLVKAFRPDWRAGEYEEEHPAEEVDWKDAREVAQLLVADIVESHVKEPEETDYLVSEERMAVLVAGIRSMMDCGFAFDARVVLDIGSGTWDSGLKAELEGCEGWPAVRTVRTALLQDLFLAERVDVPPQEMNVETEPLASVQAVDWTNPKEVALELVSVMGHDSDCTYEPTEAQLMALTGAVETMMSEEGIVFDSQLCLELAAGEESEVRERWDGARGWKELDAMLGQIFDGPSKP